MKYNARKRTWMAVSKKYNAGCVFSGDVTFFSGNVAEHLLRLEGGYMHGCVFNLCGGAPFAIGGECVRGCAIWLCGVLVLGS